MDNIDVFFEKARDYSQTCVTIYLRAVNGLAIESSNLAHLGSIGR